MIENCKDCFKDIVDGSNNSTEYGECKWGYLGANGYDAVYGIGVPNFKEIYNYIEKILWKFQEDTRLRGMSASWSFGARRS